MIDIAEVEIEAGKHDEGLARLQDATLIAKDISDSLVQGNILSDIAGRQAGMGKVETALQTTTLIKDEGRRRAALSGMLGVAGDDGDIEGVRKIIVTLEDDFGDADKDLVYGMWDDFLFITHNSAVNALIHAHVRAGDIDGALQLVDTLENDKGSFGRMDIAHAHVDAGNIPEALRIIDEIDSVIWRDEALTGVVFKQAEAGNFSDAAKVITKIKRNSEKGDAYYSLARIQMKKSGHEGDFSWIDSLKDPSHQSSALLGIAKAQIDESEPD